MTREEKRARQRRTANARFAVAAVGLVVIGFLMGRAYAQLTAPEAPVTQTQKEPPVAAASYIAPEPAPAPEEPVARYPLTEAERALIERVVAAEAAGEDFDGQALVAQCILNTAQAREMRPDAVVLEAGQYARPAPEATDQVRRAVAAVFDEGYAVPQEPVRFFYAPRYVEGRWHENSLEFVLEHGGHRFFKVVGA